jgi:hypothetical protein
MFANHITDSEQKLSSYVKVVPGAKQYAMIVCRHVAVETRLRWRSGETCYTMDGSESSAYLSPLYRGKIPWYHWLRN